MPNEDAREWCQTKFRITEFLYTPGEKFQQTAVTYLEAASHRDAVSQVLREKRELGVPAMVASLGCTVVANDLYWVVSHVEGER